MAEEATEDEPYWTPLLGLVGIIIAYFVILSAGIILIRLTCKKRRNKKALGKPADSFRRRLHMWFYIQSNVGAYIDVAQGIFSAVSCGLYVWETYQQGDEDNEYTLFIGYAERILSAMFVADYTLRFFIAKDRLMYVWSIFGIVDVITVLPVIVYITFPTAHLEDVPTYLRLVRLIKFLRVLRSLRLVRATRGFGLRRRLYTLLLSVVSLIFVAAGGFHFLEDGERDGNFYFHTALYYTTIETLGRPRIDAATNEGFFWLMTLVAISVVLIPKQIAELYSVSCAETVYQRKLYNKHGAQHIVITGHLDFGSVNCILYEFYHKDRGYHSSDVVLFFDQPPTKEVEMLLEHPAYVGIVQYVQGSALVEDDLHRVEVATASAVVVLANKNPQDPFWEDCRTTSTVLSCKGLWHRGGHLREPDHVRLRVLAQVLKPSTREQLMRTPGWEQDDVALVISEFSSIMVGLNALHPGFTTLIFNLFSHVEEQKEAPTWYREYESGALQEIYRVVVGKSLEGVTMADAAEYLLMQKGIVLLAIEVVSPGQHGQTVQMLLYPGPQDHVLAAGDRIFCIAYNVFLALSNTAENTSTVNDEWMIRAATYHKNQKEGANSSSVQTLRRTLVESLLGEEDTISTAAQWASSRKSTVSSGEFASPERGGEVESPPPSPAVPRLDEATPLSEPESGADSDVKLASSGYESPMSPIPQELDPSSVKPPVTSLRPHPALHFSSLDTSQGRQKVLKWLLSSGYNGDCSAMQGELDAFLHEDKSRGTTKESRSSSMTPSSRSGSLAKREDRLVSACDPMVYGGEMRPSLGSEDSLHRTVTWGRAEFDDEESNLIERPEKLRYSEFQLVRPAEMEVFKRVPSKMAGHVVVFGVNNPSALWDLARLILLRSTRSLVVLTPDAQKLVEAAAQEGWLQMFDKPGVRRLFFVKGNPRSADMLEKTMLHMASAAIFLPSLPPTLSSQESTERQHRMIDSGTVALTNFAAREASSEAGAGLWTVTQLLHGAAVKFFTDHSNWRGASADPRWCDIAPLNTHALFAAGQIVAGTMLDRLLVESYFNDKAIQLLGLCIFGDEAGAHLSERPVPDSFTGKTYEDLCSHMLERRLLPLGILRESKRSYSHIFKRSEHGLPPSRSKSSKPTMTRRRSWRRMGTHLGFPELRKHTLVQEEWKSPCLDTSSEAQLPYVITNPGPEMRLKAGDRLFLLGCPDADVKHEKSASKTSSAVEAHDINVLSALLTNSSLSAATPPKQISSSSLFNL